uniref:Kazal-like domain-containing protein n=1 Tax=Heliothis virescens TaxID=7102 RepID=A0A2A4JJ29_HELVI
MEKLCVFFVIALFANGALGQADQQENDGGLDDRTTTMSPQQRQCISTCPVTAEYNPVCGTDNVTYGNPGRLNCAQSCGVNVSLLRTSPCPTAPPTVDGVAQ